MCTKPCSDPLSCLMRAVFLGAENLPSIPQIDPDLLVLGGGVVLGPGSAALITSPHRRDDTSKRAFALKGL